MYFYCYHLQAFLPDTLYLYGRKIETENIKDLDNIEKCQTKKIKITVDDVISPLLAIYNGKKTIQHLEDDIIKYFNKLKHKEITHLKNIFYDKFYKEIDVIRFAPETYKKIENFKSDFCLKIMHEFTNPIEAALISKNIKSPCVLKIKTNKTYIKFDDIESVIKTNIPKLNIASINVKLQNYDICYYSICINGCKYFVGAFKGHENFIMHKHKIEIFSNLQNLNTRILEIFADEEIDVVVFFNNLGNLLNNLQKYIICDMFLYATANLKLREYSIKELCEYFKLTCTDITNPIILSKTLFDLFIKSDVLILSKELSELSGYTINKVLNNNRAEIIEYTLFHELYDKKYLLPPEVNVSVEKYEGGKVFEPVKGYYDNLVLLLDFNSLYPSIIQEYNVCFSNSDFNSSEKGVLPKILANLVQRRKEVKKLMNNDKDNKIYYIRQMALKILANSIYGSLGYPKSRFCNYKMAAFITEKGREILRDTKKTIENELNYKVIYGDTDSIMIDTGLIHNEENIIKAKEISQEISEKINLKYKNIEIELEKIFTKLFLYAKKRYIGRYLDSNSVLHEEYKGIEALKRNFCPAASDILYKVNKILLDSDNKNIYSLLKEEYNNLINRNVEDFVINNTLNKPLSQYASNAPLPFVHLCNRLKTKGIHYKVGDVVSYVIGKTENETDFYNRAFLLTEKCNIDYDYYVQNQIMPPLMRSLALSSNINLEKIYDIFKVKYNKKAVPKLCQFKTECCNNQQFPAHYCVKCNLKIEENFYIKIVKKSIGLEIERLYSTPFECIDCKVKFEGYFLKCLYCSGELIYKSLNNEFDAYLEELLSRFTEIGFIKVCELINTHLKCSKFRVFDISPYFGDEINKNLK